jgi:hypothetical protein
MDKTHCPPGLTASKLECLFRQAGVLVQELNDAKSAAAKNTLIGTYLSQHIDQQVVIEDGDKTGKATLRCSQARSRAKKYFFEVVWDKGSDVTESAHEAGPFDRGATAPQPPNHQTDVPAATATGDQPQTTSMETRSDNPVGNGEAW